MNAAFAVIPVLLIRYGLLALVNRGALKRAAHFAPLIGREKAAYWVYQISTLAMLVYLFFLRIEPGSALFTSGLVMYALGLILYAVSTVHFARPGADGVNRKGLYKFSRNPMYAAYFIVFLGCAALTSSWIFLALLTVFQVSAHFIIRAEERWCLRQFGDAYASYMQEVRRYI